MRAIVIAVVSVFFVLPAIYANAGETYCQNVNRTGYVVNAEPLAKTMNKWMRVKGIKYKTTSKEIANTITNYCRSNPYGTADDVTNHLEQILTLAASLGV